MTNKKVSSNRKIKAFIPVLSTIMFIVGMISCWQGMNELYKFKDVSYLMAVLSFMLSFLLTFSAVILLKIKN